MTVSLSYRPPVSHRIWNPDGGSGQDVTHPCSRPKYGAGQLGALRVTELPTSRANAHIQGVAATTTSQAGYLRIILRGMFSLAVRFDVLAVNPIVETKTAKLHRKPARAMTPAEFERVRAAVDAYASREGHGGPKPGRLLPAFIEVLAATGAHPSQVLALRWSDVDLLADPPTVTISGTLVDHQRIPGKGLHRQEARKGDAPEHTVVLPQFGVEAFTVLLGETARPGRCSPTGRAAGCRFAICGGRYGPRCPQIFGGSHRTRFAARWPPWSATTWAGVSAAATEPLEAGHHRSALPAASHSRPGCAEHAGQIRVGESGG